MNSKKVLDNFYYRFSPATKEIIFVQDLGLQQQDVLLITNMTQNNTLIYNFACKTEGGKLTNSTLTLIYDTTKMSVTDQLMIVVITKDKSEEYLKNIKDTLKETNELLIEFLKKLV